MVLLFKTIPGFHQVSVRRRNEVEEIDLLIRNESADPLWVNERTSYILVSASTGRSRHDPSLVRVRSRRLPWPPQARRFYPPHT
jgi:hypothetical protein